MHKDRKKPLDTYQMYSATTMSGHWVDTYLKLAEKIKNDPEKSKRLEKQQCLACFYVAGRIGGGCTS